jgi:hypothetical protein
MIGPNMHGEGSSDIYEIGNPANTNFEGSNICMPRDPNMAIKGPNMVVEKQHHYPK